MKPVNIQLDFAEGYHEGAPWAEIDGQWHTFTFKPKNGKHTFRSSMVAIGRSAKAEGRRLMAGVAFEYDYDAKNKVITVCGPDLESARTMCLITVPEGTEEYCYQRACGQGFIYDDLGGNPYWNYLGPLTPGLEPFLRGALRGAIASLIDALEQVTELTVCVNKPPPTMPMDRYLNLLMVHKNGTFVEYFDNTKTYSAKHGYIGVESTLAGTGKFAAKANFANVIKSTGDPRIASFYCQF
jgi:hypothetical protein